MLVSTALSEINHLFLASMIVTLTSREYFRGPSAKITQKPISEPATLAGLRTLLAYLPLALCPINKFTDALEFVEY
jgi:hypothetical protein